MMRILIGLCSAFLVLKAHALTCYFTAVKDSCWTNYDVTITVADASNEKKLVSVNIPKGSIWGRESFTCQGQQELKFTAQYMPVFWESERGKVYNALNYWTLPATLAAGDTAWNIQLCYPKQFAEVPLPPDAKGNCECDLTSITPIKL